MRTTTSNTLTPQASHAAIRGLAYKLWLLADRPSGYDLTFWLHAELQIQTRLKELEYEQATVPAAKKLRERSKAA